MSLPPQFPNSIGGLPNSLGGLPNTAGGENEYVHIRCLIANLHRPRNVCRPPGASDLGPPLEVVCESPPSSDTERSESVSVSGSDRSINEIGDGDVPTTPKRPKSNSIAGGAGSLLTPPTMPGKRRRSFLHLNVGLGGEHAPGPLSAGAHLNVPRFTVTAPPGEREQHRRHSHAFAAFHGFALRRHSNTV